ncbi:acylneuraminate cytidylyltransferase family protein [Roseobacter litoralis]|uniref:N-acylneuraminate cytidylyltransferase n=1 Tax=Roseobacter litoralis (strain ATCC 49566 / DSM 6996 / JCM 21268 / NBRC 15278 / OCh 149) TaxID=391595 RepID=F7ZJ64_ROSLO|nr:acylneuraminate cytidylyltransferase family protein [Roseobacter litoralis]AEI96309.1 putative N-acylneuraminate cytidylyltransferase [Roseobacter litoralis Och 149]
MTERLCVIPVRAGSKGLPDKNIREFRGKPLVAHSVQQAIAANIFAEVAVSSDSDAYLEIARQAGATRCLKRPAELASDTAGSIEVVAHALVACEEAAQRRYGSITLLQATSPLREGRHIRESVAQLEEYGFDSVLSVTPAKNSPYFNMLEFDHHSATYVLSKPLDAGVLRRQDAPEVFQLNGSIYVWSRSAFLSQGKSICDRTGIYVMPPLNSVDIDTQDDWAFAELAAKLLDERKADKQTADRGQ